ncbi:MAG TPA: GNAT family protein, partial [Thermomicrobiales bacterium]|nr:GNAT family protein [Thermomicrobiales bacterium]
MTETLTKPDAGNPELGHLHQTFLVGDEIYLRQVEKSDAELTVSWRPSLLPFSPERTESWIEDDLAKGRQSWHVIVRKADDRVVGSITIRSRGPATYLDGYVDPFYGAQGERWKAEAFRLVLPWLVDEQHRVSLQISVPATETQVIAALEASGARQTARFRQMLSHNGERVDLLRFAYLNAMWVAR